MPSPRSKFFARALLGLFAAGTAAVGMAASPAAPSPVTIGSAPAPMSGAEVIGMLDQTVDWYRTLATQQQYSTEPSDLLILYENRQIAGQVVALAFEVARAAAMLVPKDASAPESDEAAQTSKNLAQLQAKLDAQAAAAQSEIDATRQKLASAPRKAKQQLQAKIAELQGEIDLLNTKKGILAGMAGVVDGAGSGRSATNALRAQIDAMAVALPSIADSPAPVPAAGGSSTATAAHAPAAGGSSGPPALAASSVEGSRFGIWDIAANVFKLSEKMSALDTVDLSTEALQNGYAQIRAKIAVQIRAMSARGDSLMAQADAADSATLEGVRSQLDALAAQFKQASAMLIPLSRQTTLLKQYRHNLKNWHDAVKDQSRDALRALGLRLGMLLLILAVVFVLAEAWRRAVHKYVQDMRRRYQLLLLRKIALWSLVVVIVGFTFASELSSIVTFAGLITAGLAVAMQSVLVSIVGYFFLIGKYGIRVGDRVQIGEVNGEVIELGMVRMYLMEFAGQSSASPTGRVAAFPNSVVFQVSAGLFKQIPGVNFAWHDITLSVPSGVDYSAIKEELFAAANEALTDYREEIKRQTIELQRTTSSNAGGDALPTVQLSYSAKGVDAHVRYPVHLSHAAEIDERMSRALLQVISGLASKGPPGAPAGG
ncbi:MAG: mechanosensitive ion channel domain-containing protein [Steroidobacteraceae bacterium]|jgi:small-conductance mechanosensitive channel